jgi:hypothetical protein
MANKNIKDILKYCIRKLWKEAFLFFQNHTQFKVTESMCKMMRNKDKKMTKVTKNDEEEEKKMLFFHSSIVNVCFCKNNKMTLKKRKL